MKTFIFIIMFLLIGAFFIISNENIKMNTKENVFHFLGLYASWFDQLLGNSKTATGYLVKMEWLPGSGSP